MSGFDRANTVLRSVVVIYSLLFRAARYGHGTNRCEYDQYCQYLDHIEAGLKSLCFHVVYIVWWISCLKRFL